MNAGTRFLDTTNLSSHPTSLRRLQLTYYDRSGFGENRQHCELCRHLPLYHHLRCVKTYLASPPLNCSYSGVHLTLFLYLLRLYFDRNLRERMSRRQQSRPRWRFLACVTPLFLLATIGICLQTWLDQRTSLDHRCTSGACLSSVATQSHSSGNLAITAVYVRTNGIHEDPIDVILNSYVVLSWFADGMLASIL